MGPRAEQPGSQGKTGARTVVEDAGGRRPFMRGIMIHSLMSQGLDFDDAYKVACSVRDRIRDKAVVTRDELAALAHSLIDPSKLADAQASPRPGTILVGGYGKGTPFSKGFLSQSLLAAAIDPSDAFDVAREIEEELRVSETVVIDRHDLRHMAYATLARRLGDRPAERYLVWRHHKRAERPLILLLGGATGVGKTALAQEVAHRLGIAGVISTDSIRQVMRIMLSKDLVPAIHASSYDAWRVVPERDDDADPVIEAFRDMASTVTVGVRAMIDRAIAENSSLILDGVSLMPGGLDLSAYQASADVIFLLVATLDPEAIAGRFSARAAAGERARPPHRYLENLDAILRVQDYLLELAEIHDVPIVDNESFDRSVISIIRHATETLRKKGDFDVSELL